jgi:hypothetical protein
MKPQNEAQPSSGGRLWKVAVAVAVVLIAPVVVLAAVATNLLLRKRWPDRALAWLFVAVGSVSVAVLLLVTHYPAAWSRVAFGWWHPSWLPKASRKAARLDAWWPAMPDGSDWAQVIALGVVLGLVLGGVWWRLRQHKRERSPYNGEDERERRQRCEERRRRIFAGHVQSMRHTGPAAVQVMVAPLAVPLGDAQGPFVGRYQRGDLGGHAYRLAPRTAEERLWRASRPGAPPCVRLPLASGAVRHLVVLGATGLGKTESTLAVCEWAMRHEWQVVYLSAKEPPSIEDAAAPRLAAVAESLGKTSRVLEQGYRPYDPMRGTLEDVRDRFVRIEEWGDRYWQHCANLLLGLVLEMSAAHGHDVRTMPELVFSLTRTRLKDLAERNNDPRVKELIEAIEDRALSGALTRYASMAMHLRDWIGSSGGFSFEDADVIVAELPTGRRPEAGKALLRLMVRDFGSYLIDPQRRQHDAVGDPRPVLFVVEEAGAVAGDPVIGQEFVDLVERGRTARATALLTAQDPLGLGDERAVSALLTNGTILSYRQTTQSETVAELAGTRRVDEGSVTWDVVGGHGVAGSTRRQYAFKLSPQYLREIGRSECVLIAGGKYAAAVAGMPASGYRLPDSEEAAALVLRAEERVWASEAQEPTLVVARPALDVAPDDDRPRDADFRR